MNWYAIYTKPRNEKKVAENLTSIGVEVYCPMISVVKQWSDRKKTTLQPLLNSYIFVRLDEKDRPKVFDVPGVVRFLFWLGKPAIVRDIEIVAIKELLQEKYKEVLVSGIQAGQKFIVESGAFKGKEAIFKEQKGSKIILVLESLGMTLILEK